MGNESITGTVGEMLDNYEGHHEGRLDEPCHNTFCSNEGTVVYYENKRSDGFAVCRECYEILNA